MPKIGVKEEVKTKKKSTATIKKDTKKVDNTKKGKAKETKLVKTPKKEKETLLEKLVSTTKKVVEEKPKATRTKKVAEVKEEKPKTTRAKKVAEEKQEKPKATRAKKVAEEKQEKPKATRTKKVTEVKEEKPKATRAKKVAEEKQEKTKTTRTKKTTTAKKETVKKSTVKKVSKKTTTTKKANVKKVNKKEEKKTYLPEYYDLPYRYNDTLVKILYQTPKRIFVYWDISDSDRQRYVNAFGEDFYEKTYPVLLVHNEDMNYTFEVIINDFANSWYIDINDSKSKYIVQLGRKFKEIQKEQINYTVIEDEKINLQNDFVYITHSNRLETPNDKILFEKVPEKITFRNVKTGEIIYKETKQVLRKIAKTYTNSIVYDNPKIEDLYRKLYGDEILLEEMNIISNPSSGATSSFFK